MGQLQSHTGNHDEINFFYIRLKSYGRNNTFHLQICGIDIGDRVRRCETNDADAKRSEKDAK
jgi:hypothetical protein